MKKAHALLWIMSAVSRLTSFILSHWKLVLVIAIFVSPVGPYLRWEYSYENRSGAKFFIQCTYLGPRGFVTPEFFGDCPVIAILDVRDWGA